jgi:hypothetical protein
MHVAGSSCPLAHRCVTLPCCAGRPLSRPLRHHVRPRLASSSLASRCVCTMRSAWPPPATPCPAHQPDAGVRTKFPPLACPSRHRCHCASVSRERTPTLPLCHRAELSHSPHTRATTHAAPSILRLHGYIRPPPPCILSTLRHPLVHR